MSLFRNKNSIVNKAKEANEVLTALGIETHTETGKQVRAALAMELLGQKYDLMDKHSKASFMKQHGEVVHDVRQMLIEEGVLTNPGNNTKKKK